MPLQSLSIAQKREIVKEHRARQKDGRKATHAALAEWAKGKFGLSKVPGKAVMSRIFNNPSLTNTPETTPNHNTFRVSGPRHIELDKAICAWVCDMRHKRRCISSLSIQEKGRRLSSLANEKFPGGKKVKLKFSDGWLARFKQRWKLKSFRLHGEGGDVPEETCTGASCHSKQS